MPDLPHQRQITVDDHWSNGLGFHLVIGDFGNGIEQEYFLSQHLSKADFHECIAAVIVFDFTNAIGLLLLMKEIQEREPLDDPTVLKVDEDNNLLVVEGGIPGAPSSYVIVRKAITAKRLKVAQVEKPKKGKK